jgi:large subunit ribosomal protein L4
MATIKVLSLPGGKVTSREQDFTETLGKRPHRRVMREAVLMYQANARQGTHATRTRAEVDFTNKKPWAQKHTGRARAGTRRSPLWRKGGIIHGPQPRDYGYSMPRKALRAALQSALLAKLQAGQVHAVEGLALDKPSTKAFAGALKTLGVTGSCLVVLPAPDGTLYRSARNLDATEVRASRDVNALDVLRHKNLILVNGAFDAVVKGDARG